MRSSQHKIWMEVHADGKNRSFGCDEHLSQHVNIGIGPKNSLGVGRLHVRVLEGADENILMYEGEWRPLLGPTTVLFKKLYNRRLQIFTDAMPREFLK